MTSFDRHKGRPLRACNISVLHGSATLICYLTSFPHAGPRSAARFMPVTSNSIAQLLMVTSDNSVCWEAGIDIVDAAMDIAQLCSILEACMSPNQQQRAAAEQTLKQVSISTGVISSLWEPHMPSDPEAEWNICMIALSFLSESYSSGHSGRGRIYLPTAVESAPCEQVSDVIFWRLLCCMLVPTCQRAAGKPASHLSGAKCGPRNPPVSCHCLQKFSQGKLDPIRY